MKKRRMWSLQFSTAAFVLIPAAVGINFLGKLFASVLKLAIMGGRHRNCVSEYACGSDCRCHRRCRQ